MSWSFEQVKMRKSINWFETRNDAKTLLAASVRRSKLHEDVILDENVCLSSDF